MKASPRQYALALLAALADKSPAERTKIIQNFVRKFYYQGRPGLLKKIVDALENTAEAASGTVNVTVASAREFGGDFVKKIVTKLLDGAKPKITQRPDDSLLAGLTVETKNKRWDISARGQLKQLKKKLNN